VTLYLTFSIRCEYLIGILKYFALNNSRTSSTGIKSEPYLDFLIDIISYSFLLDSTI
jgi:hypothetical protein